jgi:hypothetical protein
MAVRKGRQFRKVEKGMSKKKRERSGEIQKYQTLEL